MGTKKSLPGLFKPLFDAANEGNDRSHKFLVKVAIVSLKEGKLPPSDLLEYFLAAIDDPETFAKKMREVKRTKRGRPPDDDKTLTVDVGLGDKFFGSKPSHKYAMILAYLVSIGHPIGQVPKKGKESAIALLSDLTGRSTRSLQRDYRENRHRLSGSKKQLDLGCAYFEAKQYFQKISEDDLNNKSTT
jgi:hypothetical protein